MVDGVQVGVELTEENPLVSDFIASHGGLRESADVETNALPLVLTAGVDGLRLAWIPSLLTRQTKKRPRALELHIDVNTFVAGLRSFPAQREGAFNQAIGRRSKRIADLTGGWGGDALLLCAQGYQVTVLERHPLMALLLAEAMHRLQGTAWAQNNDVSVPRVMMMSAEEFFLSSNEDFDCLYLDPMFPSKQKKSAAANKYMQFLHWLPKTELGSAQLLDAALATKTGRVVVKRPSYAEPLKANPQARFSGKLVHYDLYLPQQAT